MGLYVLNGVMNNLHVIIQYPANCWDLVQRKLKLPVEMGNTICVGCINITQK